MIRQAKLTNGIRVIMEPMDNLRSVSIGVWVNAGSVYEAGADAGISHFIEHMVFKGTARRSAADIAAEMDAVGGNLNAFTAKECTCFYAKVLDENLPLAVDMLSDITLHPAIDEQEMEKEKRVVVEEILMSEDSPEDKAFETAGSAYYEGTALASGHPGYPRDRLRLHPGPGPFLYGPPLRHRQHGHRLRRELRPETLLPLLEEAFGDCPRGEETCSRRRSPGPGRSGFSSRRTRSR